MKYPATFGLAAVLLITLTACGDPQHGAWKVKSGIWMGWVLILVALLGALLVVGAWAWGMRRRLPRSANFEVFKAQQQ